MSSLSETNKKQLDSLFLGSMNRRDERYLTRFSTKWAKENGLIQADMD